MESAGKWFCVQCERFIQWHESCGFVGIEGLAGIEGSLLDVGGNMGRPDGANLHTF